jgi:hypothetical protein
MMAAVAPGAAALVAGLFAVALLRRYGARGRLNPALVYWAAALGMFGVAAAALAYAAATGWSSGWFRAYYLFGGVLVVPWLALGTVQTASRDPVTLRVLGATSAAFAVGFAVPLALADAPALYLPGVVLAALWALLLLVTPGEGAGPGSLALVATFTAVAVFVVLTEPIPAPVPATGLPEGGEVFTGRARGLALGPNILGSALVIVGAGVTAYRLRAKRLPHLVIGNLLIAVGVLVAASGGAFAFLGDLQAHAVAFAVGVTVMYAGFVRTTRPPGEPPTGVAGGEGGEPR